MLQKEKQMAEKIENTLLGMIEIYLEHISRDYISSETGTFNIFEHFIFEVLGKKDSASMGELARIFHRPATTMTSIIDRLVRKGYLIREYSEQDRRKVLVRFSEKGEQYYQRHRQESLMLWSDILSRLPDKGEKLFQSLLDFKRSLNHQRIP